MYHNCKQMPLDQKFFGFFIHNWYFIFTLIQPCAMSRASNPNQEYHNISQTGMKSESLSKSLNCLERMKSILIWWRIDIRISYNWTYIKTEFKKCNLMDFICKTQPKSVIKYSWCISPVITRIMYLHKSKPLAKSLTHDLSWTLVIFTLLLSYAYWLFRTLTWNLAGANCRNLCENVLV